jgi:fatty acid desaturase
MANQWWVTLLCLFGIASFQHGLLVIMHDASHYRLFKNRDLNDFVANIFLAFPHFVTTEGYRLSHLLHHQFLNTDKDPDYVGRIGKPDWEFPKSKPRVFWLLTKDVFGNGFFEMLKKLYRYARQAGLKSGNNPSHAHAPMGYRQASPMFRWSYYALMCVSLTAFGVWTKYLLYWLLPAFWLLPAILRNRSLAEHFGLRWSHELNSSRNVIPNFIERIFLCPWGVNFHLNHHLFPSVPFYNLRKLENTLLENPFFRHNSHENVGYIIGRKPYILDLTS